MTYNLYFFHQF